MSSCAVLSLLDQFGVADYPGGIFRNVDLKLFTRSTAVPLMQEVWMWVSIPPQVHNELFGLFCVEQQVVGVTLFGQLIHLLFIGGLFAVLD